MSKVLCVLYPDPMNGYPTSYARDEVPKLDRYPDGQTLPSPRRIDFTPGALLGSVSGELGLRKFLKANGHEFVVTADKDGPGCDFDRELPDAEVVIPQPPPKDHPWRTMPHHAMTPHVSGTTLSASHGTPPGPARS